MSRRVKPGAVVLRADEWRAYVLVALAGVLAVVLGATFAVGGQAPDAARAGERLEMLAPEDDDEEVTMEIELEEGGAIDLEVSVGQVSVDTWEGDDVLLVVQKRRKAPNAARGERRSDPVSIQVTRSGKDVRIATEKGAVPTRGGFDVALRIMVPSSSDTKPAPRSSYDFTKLASVILKAVHNEALRWIAR